MKRKSIILLVVLILVSFAITGCNKKHPIIGEWVVEIEEGIYADASMSFYEGGKGKLREEIDEVFFEYEILDNKSLLLQNDSYPPEEFPYSI